MKMIVRRTNDFDLTGRGSSPEWEAAAWQPLARVGDGAAGLSTRMKTLYSDTSLYVLFDCEDRRLTCTMTRDFADLYLEDVVELFLQPEPGQRVYFEYEISPLGRELPIMVANDGRRFHGWLPWKYEGGRRVRRRTAVRGGRRAPGASCAGWTAEVAIPYALLLGLAKVPPRPGVQWRGNFYRIDYDESPCSQWAWCARTGPNFHAFRRFGTLSFA
jgi:hypothetical protein